MATYKKLSSYQLITFWRMNDWGQYGRRYEMCLKEIARRRLFNRVFLITPPIHFSVEKSFLIKFFLKIYRLIVPFKVERLEYGIIYLKPFYSFLRPRFLKKSSMIVFLMYLWFIFYFKKSLFLAYPYHSFIKKIVKRCKFNSIISDIVDDNTDIGIYTKDRREHILHQYKILLEKSDVVFTTSSVLSKKFPEYISKIFYLPNGIDADLIVRNDTRNKTGAAGYIGFIDHRIDFQLIEKILNNYPHIKFIFSGPVHFSCKEKIDRFSRNFNNFKYNGAIAYSNLRKTIADFDIGIIPYRRNEFIASMSPLKLYQFLGQGRPVVVMNNSIDEELTHMVYVSNDSNDFVKNIDKALSETGVEWLQIRTEYARKNTWEQRVDIMLEEINRSI